MSFWHWLWTLGCRHEDRIATQGRRWFVVCAKCDRESPGIMTGKAAACPVCGAEAGEPCDGGLHG